MNEPEYDFLKEYIQYNKGNECPQNYHIWSALTILAAAVHKRVHINRGYFEIYPNLYVCLVGKQGNRKSTAKDIAASLFQDALPNYPIGASVQSRETIIMNMSAGSECLFSFKDTEGTIQEVRSMIIFINEFKNFVSVDPAKMIEFLTDIYSSKHFKSSTIKRGLEDLKNPCLNLLACEVPEWIIDKMKMGLVSGGFARRMIYVYEIDEPPRIPFPEKPFESAVMWTRMKEHLQRVHHTTGIMEWTPEAREFWTDWYKSFKIPEDEVMAGYYRSKGDLVLKVSILVCLARWPIKLVLTSEVLEIAVAMLDVLEINMPKLSQAAGKNEHAAIMQKLLDALNSDILGNEVGWMPEKAVIRLLSKDLNGMEIVQVLRQLQDMEEIVVRDVAITISEQKMTKKMVMTKEKFQRLQEEQKK